MESVWSAVADCRAFMSASQFVPWLDICGVEQSAFVERYMQRYIVCRAFVSQEVEKCAYQLLCSANKRVHKSRSASDAESSATSCAGSAHGSVVGVPTCSASREGKREMAASLSLKKSGKEVESQTVSKKRKTTVKTSSSQSKDKYPPDIVISH